MQAEDKAIVFLVHTIHLPDLEQIARERLRDLAAVRTAQNERGKELGRELRDATAVIIDADTNITQEVVDEMKQCKIIITASVGFDHIDLNAASSRGIYVSNVPGYCTEEVADHTIGLMIAVTRKILILNKTTRTGAWDDWHAAEPVYRLRDRTLGIVGLGRIGTAVSLRAKALGLKVIAYDPYIPIGRDTSVGVKSVKFDSLLSESDIISMHTPLTDENRHMIGSKEFEKMKHGVFIINTARGALIDPKALADALHSGKVAGAGIDVFEKEPPDQDDPLLRIDTVVVTSHTGFLSTESQRDRQIMAVDEVERILRNELPRSALNPDILSNP
jgi:D-3-phosphoglycerate dehydrogenase / 2-oxoglutarate reductase